MIIVQRLFALMLAAGMVFVFLIPTAMHRRQYGVVWIVLAVFVAWIAANSFLFMRSRKRKL
ncbi:MAG: hypothetical protein M3Y21_02825 [Candidatus Eremiobacteraeota bacterium]|nr:hypothetical protein [Candidatus Eremiobacteraeota bacterium]